VPRSLANVGDTRRRPRHPSEPYVCCRIDWHERGKDDFVRVPVWSAKCDVCQAWFEQRTHHPDIQRCKACIGSFGRARHIRTADWRDETAAIRAAKQAGRQPPSAVPPPALANRPGLKCAVVWLADGVVHDAAGNPVGSV
jgi:hypothetical protein